MAVPACLVMLVRLSCKTLNKTISTEPGRTNALRQLELYLDWAALIKSVDVPGSSGGKARLVKKRRMQKIRCGADFLKGMIGEPI